MRNLVNRSSRRNLGFQDMDVEIDCFVNILFISHFSTEMRKAMCCNRLNVT